MFIWSSALVSIHSIVAFKIPFIFFLASGILPEEISLTSTPKRPNLPQAMSTPAPVSMAESVETVEAKAALKQVYFSINTVESYHYFLLLL